MEPSSRGRVRVRTESDPADRSWVGLSPSYVRRSAAQRLKVLGHPDRLRIVEALNGRALHVGDIAARLELPLATVSRHMRVLRVGGVVDCSPHGNRVLYTLTDREVPRLAAIAYRGAAVQARRLIATAEPASQRAADTPSLFDG